MKNICNTNLYVNRGLIKSKNTKKILKKKVKNPNQSTHQFTEITTCDDGGFCSVASDICILLGSAAGVTEADVEPAPPPEAAACMKGLVKPGGSIPGWNPNPKKIKMQNRIQCHQALHEDMSY